MVSLRPLNESNRQAVEALRVSPSQEQYVSSVTDSLLEAAEHPDARALYWAVHAEDTPVGFVMIADEVRSPPYIPQYLWKLLIDERLCEWPFMMRVRSSRAARGVARAAPTHPSCRGYEQP